MGGLGVFTDQHVNANYRTVNLMFFFSSCRTSNWRIAILQVFSFLIIYQSIRDRCKRTFIKVDFQYAHYFDIEKEWKMLFNTAKANIFGCDGLFYTPIPHRPRIARIATN